MVNAEADTNQGMYNWEEAPSDDERKKKEEEARKKKMNKEITFDYGTFKKFR